MNMMWWHCEDANARSTSDWFELLISDNSCDAHYDELGDQFAFNFWALADDHQQKVHRAGCHFASVDVGFPFVWFNRYDCAWPLFLTR